MLGIVAAAATDVGWVRDVNEDALFIGSQLFAVADGMGGHAAGEIASQLVISAMAQGDGTAVSPNDLRDLIARASMEIAAYATHNPTCHGLGTTVAGFALTPGPSANVVVFHVGDSRVYRLVGGSLERLTIDHSEVAELVAAGRITDAEGRNHPGRHVLTRAIMEGHSAHPDIRIVAAGPEDRWLIASDGLTGELDDAEVAVLLKQHANPQTCADALVAAALAAGGRDNVTVIVADVAGLEELGDVETTSPRSLSWRTEE